MNKEVKEIIKEKSINYKQYKRAKELFIEDKYKDLKEDFEIIDTFLAMLEPTERKLMIYSFIEDSSTEETAIDLYLSKSTLYKKQALIVEKFKKFIEK